MVVAMELHLNLMVAQEVLVVVVPLIAVMLVQHLHLDKVMLVVQEQQATGLVEVAEPRLLELQAVQHLLLELVELVLMFIQLGLQLLAAVLAVTLLAAVVVQHMTKE